MSLPYYKRFPRDFFEATIGMSGEVKGAYGLLLDLIYMLDGELNDDPKYISGMLGLSVRKWNAIKNELVLRGKIIAENDIISNLKADKIILERRSYQDKKAQNRAKPNKNNDLYERPFNSARVKPEPEPDISIDSSASASVFDQCLKAAGLAKSEIVASPGLMDFSLILNLLSPDQESPCDLERDALPAIKACAATLKARNQNLNSWRYCREAILRNRDQRITGTPAPDANTARTNNGKATSPKRASGSKSYAAMRLRDQIRANAEYADDIHTDDSERGDRLERGRIDNPESDGTSSAGKDFGVAGDAGRDDGFTRAGRQNIRNGDGGICTQTERLAG